MRSLSAGRTAMLVLLIVILVVLLFSSYTIVNPGHRGVVVFLGNVEEDNVLSDGFHLILPPLLRKVVEVDVRTRKLEVVADAASRDLQSMQVTGVLNYHLAPDDVGYLYQEVGLDYENIIIIPAMHEAIKAATALYRVEDVLSKRAEIKQRIQQELSERLGQSHIVVDQFSIANVEFSDEFDQAIERKQIAEQAAQQKEYELQAAQKDIEIAIARAEAERESTIKQAEGRARARELEAAAEANALSLIAKELQDRPELIQYQWAVRLGPNVSAVLLPSDQALILSGDALLGAKTPTVVPETPTVTPMP